MRYFEISSGLRVPVDSEEHDLVDFIKDNKNKIYKSSLQERDQVICQKLISKGIVNINKDDKGIFYSLNSNIDLWRI